jgi:hypothetical protein
MTSCNHDASVYLWVGRYLRFVACSHCDHNQPAPLTWEYHAPIHVPWRFQ